ncbi:hypothetical protein Sj15T_37320 [Sphingobium sp. TA15]|uniref:Uncharacterized protein n=2 Tax=Sphingobium indicum TaxID=332055 RepID=D4Z845_SPHIU|nr:MULTISPECIES: hypothetical protein [Sphingobium]EPR19103.1 hypothetical protein M527_00010 [Sphingobium indicum IP26]KER37943.1 hypothetical protein AL00_02820 [Sphingobium indicum F2]BAI98664.1 hypothetical protein SJA_C2-03010 [Sphingobium indicum UT26S]BDD68711.1 hypothetical protein Sj15T_37320 [Sphingobium sp. TA15]
MVWGRFAAKCALAGCVAGLGAQAAAETMVVRATGPSAATYKPGSKLADGGSIALKAGDVVTLLDARGTRTLRGPGSFNVAAANAAPANSVMLSALLDTKRVRRARTGAVRGSVGEAPPAAPRRPNLWMVDVAQSGTLCIADPASVRLWRADASKPATIGISGEGVQATASFRMGESVAPWPVAAPVREGAAYRLSDGSRAADVRFALIDPASLGLDGVASGLIAHQCMAQLDLLVETATLSDRAARN